MSKLRNQAPQQLLDMFERREDDVRPTLPVPPSTRRRIRTRRTVTAAAVVVACAILVGVAVRALPLASTSRPAVPSPEPPLTQLRPTVTGHTELFRWRLLEGSEADGRIYTALQTSSLAGGEWTTVAERRFDPAGTSFTATYLAAGQFLDRPSTTVVWGFVPSGSDRIVLEPGDGCDPITVDVGDADVPGQRLWGTNVRCSGPGTIVAQRSDGTEIARTSYMQPIPTDVWAITSSRHGGIGWVLRRILDAPSGIGIGDAGVPSDLRSPIRGDQLTDDSPVAWAMTPPAEDGRFVFGIAAGEIDHVALVLPGGDTVDATFTVLPGDGFDIFWADVDGTTPVQLVGFDAACAVIANESLNGAAAGDPPSDACTPNG